MKNNRKKPSEFQNLSINIDEVLKEYNKGKSIENAIEEAREELETLQAREDKDYDLEFNQGVVEALQDLQKTDQRNRIAVNSLAKSLQVIISQQEDLYNNLSKLITIGKVLTNSQETILKTVEQKIQEDTLVDMITRLIQEQREEEE